MGLAMICLRENGFFALEETKGRAACPHRTARWACGYPTIQSILFIPSIRVLKLVNKIGKDCQRCLASGQKRAPISQKRNRGILRAGLIRPAD